MATSCSRGKPASPIYLTSLSWAQPARPNHPMKIVTADQMRRIEERSEQAGVSTDALMENAGLAVAERIRHHVGRVDGTTVVVLVGPGNNGGDGLVAARHLHDWGARVVAYLYPGEGRAHAKMATLDRDIDVLSAAADDNLTALKYALGAAPVVLDALLGTGRSRPIEGVLRDVLLELARAKASRPGLLVFALDLPTGIDSDTGAADPACPGADFTVTLGRPKVGLYLSQGVEMAGVTEVVDIGIPDGLDDDIGLELITESWVRPALPERQLSAHKGTFGKAMVVAGSQEYVGAAYLAASAAGRAGAGLVTLAIPRSLQMAVAAKAVEPTYLPLPESAFGVPSAEAAELVLGAAKGYDSLLVGCGLGQADATHKMVECLLYSDRSLPPTVVDADGLNILAHYQDSPWWERFSKAAIVTPHAGEMARLSGTSTETVLRDRIGLAVRSATAWNKVVVLKGSHTVVALPDGRAAISPYANPALASAGTGDVLAGTIVGLLAQGKSLEDAAKLGIYLHGAAGELVADDLGDAGLLAGDLLPVLPRVMKELKAGGRARGPK